MSKWQSIETAPKEGTRIMLFPHYLPGVWEGAPEGRQSLFSRRSSSSSTTSRMNLARLFFPATASMRCSVSSGKRTSVGLVSESF